MRSLALFALLALSSPASAQTTPYVAEMRAAIGLLAAGDSSGAAEALRESIARAPTRPEAHCHLGAALTRLGNRDGALESYRACARLANRADDRFHEATGLHGVVRLLIEDAGRREEAKSAVEALRTFAIANPSVLSPEIPEELGIALDRIEAADRSAAAVRQRREARRASGSVSSD
ncbi:MAG: tetratricopeptide repeat protein [Myxococcota bacterium]|nr:tetratricopeptide repeat protein [Myxococcota bacterium]